MQKSILISCEHAGNAIPAKYSTLFEAGLEQLNTHRGYDIGAKQLYDLILHPQIDYKQACSESRLLVDVNRSLYRRTLFSEFTKPLSKELKADLLKSYYYAYRDKFEARVREQWDRGSTVLHLSIHSFTPVLNGVTRETDFGILYNPERKGEKLFANLLKAEISKFLPGKRVRFNYPFRGKPDGFVRHFRDRESSKYLGIEFEMNQKHANDNLVYAGLKTAFYSALEMWMHY